MNFNNIEEIKKYGFKCFESVKDLREDSSRIPKKRSMGQIAGCVPSQSLCI